MAREIRLPQFGQTMEEGTIVNCPVKVGDEVRRGDCVFEIETDKTTLEMESPADGFVKYILVEVGQTLPVGEPLLVLGGKNEQVPQRFLDSLKAAAAEVPPLSQLLLPSQPGPLKQATRNARHERSRGERQGTRRQKSNSEKLYPSQKSRN